MHYDEAIKYLFSLSSFEREGKIGQGQKNFNLDEYKRFLQHLGNPQDGLKYIHVAGSKGKGSTCNFIAKALQEHSFKVALFTSPFITHIRELFQINGQWISKDDLLETFNIVKSALDSFDGQITYFEFVTTIAFVYFKGKKVDYVVLEVGLGGTFDSTNVVNPIMTVLTQIELEHTNILGDTVEEVLKNKLGIMKKGIPMIVSWQKFDLSSQIQEKAHDLAVKVTYLEQDFSYEIKGLSVEGTEFVFENKARQIGLIGEAYIKSALTAFKLLKDLLENFDEEKFWKASKEVKMSARFEVFKRKDAGYIVFDMAHTRFGAKFLRESLNEVFSGKKFVFLISMLKDKDVKSFLGELIEETDRVFFTKSAINRALSAKELAEQFEGECVIESDPEKAFRQILENIKKDEILVVTGSHFLLYDLYALV